MEKPREPLSTQELVDQLYSQHDAEIHAIFSRLMEVEVDLDDKPKRPWGEDND